MNAERLVTSLERFADVLPPILRAVEPSEYRWRPENGAWSILEIVSHLADEEVEDFRQRLGLTLRDPAAAWPPIDPEGWATERRYNDGEVHEALERFLAERRASVAWLRDLPEPDWSCTHRHPKLGSIRAGDLLAAWVAHDWLHLRQISKRVYQLINENAGKYSSGYAGSLAS